DSVSQEPERVRLCADWLAHPMAALGLGPPAVESGGAPAVVGEGRVPGATPPLLLSCHYDTKPIPRDGWLQPSPVEPVFRAGLAETGAPIVPFKAVATDPLSAAPVH